jgi:hypothetical protein
MRDMTPQERQEVFERHAKRRQEELAERNRPMNPDRDISWENTNFRDFEND